MAPHDDVVQLLGHSGQFRRSGQGRTSRSSSQPRTVDVGANRAVS
jgi:hypothetical protein